MIDSISVSAAGPRISRPTLVTVVWLCLFALVSIGAIALRLGNREVAWRTPDERVYMDYAKQVARSGIQGVRALVESYNKDKQQWIYPPPVRVGHIYLVAGVMKLSGASAEQAAVSVSSTFSILGFVVVALLGLRFFNRWAVLIGLALLSVSPIDLAIARRAWQDSVWGCIGLFLFYLCMEASVSSRPKFWRICFWVVAAYFLVIKESALVVYGLCTLWLVGSAWLQERSLQKGFRIAIMSALVAAASFAALAWCSGGAGPLVETIRHTVEAREWNQYGHQYQRGPWHSFLTGFWVMSPITALLAIVGIATMTGPRNSRLGLLTLDPRQRQIGWAMVYLISTLVFALTVAADLKNLRYVTILLGPCCLLSGLGMVHLLVLAKSNLTISGYRSTVCAAVLILGLTCLTDYRRFERVFVRYALDDLAIVRVINYALAAGSNADKAPLEVMASSEISAAGPPVSRLPGTPESYLALSLQFYREGRYFESVVASRLALDLRPGYAEAWNNIGAAYNQLGRYDEAAAACEQALRYKPDFDLARNNLEYARMKRLGH
ncbi:MAG: hypothetical protein DLM73_11765 [Chthoniobacterales bacterium]|nr:MAG: hypothetical protein DLM73_11765 [Chthoniobacterales bacterium]